MFSTTIFYWLEKRIERVPRLASSNLELEGPLSHLVCLLAFPGPDHKEGKSA
jgi:hypothetical protein